MHPLVCKHGGSVRHYYTGVDSLQNAEYTKFVKLHVHAQVIVDRIFGMPFVNVFRSDDHIYTYTITNLGVFLF